MLEADILRTSDGAVRTYRDDRMNDSVYMWEEGNYSCDCNRRLFFLRAADEDEPEDTPCGEKEFRVVSLRFNGEEIYSEAH